MTGVASHRLRPPAAAAVVVVAPAVVGAPLAFELMTGVASQRARLVRTGGAASDAVLLFGEDEVEDVVDDVDDVEEEDEAEDDPVSFSLSLAS